MIIKDSPFIDEQVLELRMMVACHNAGGEPDFFFCKVRCRRAEYNDGEHYALAGRRAEKEGYIGPMVTIDEHDPAGRAILDHFVWDSATIYIV